MFKNYMTQVNLHIMRRAHILDNHFRIFIIVLASTMLLLIARCCWCTYIVFVMKRGANWKRARNTKNIMNWWLVSILVCPFCGRIFCCCRGHMNAIFAIHIGKTLNIHFPAFMIASYVIFRYILKSNAFILNEISCKE